jgi:hypothetical protein
MPEETNNPQTSTESTVAQGTQQEQVQAGTGEQKQQEEVFFDPKSVPPELEQAYKQMQGAFTKKTQEIADIRKKAESLDQLVGYKPFVDWYQKHTSGQDKVSESESPAKDSKQEQPKQKELSDEEFELLKTDKNRFMDYVKELARQESLPIALKAQQKVEYLETVNKIEAFAKDHPDFWDLDQKGLIETTIKKYPNLEIDDIYRLAKYPFLEQEAVQKAHQIVQQKKDSVVEKPTTSGGTNPVKKFKSRLEAMIATADAVAAGQEPPNWELDK